jgi:multimeric flavodoxin WrbA
MPISPSDQKSIDRRADAAPGRYANLRAVIFNGTLERSPEPSRTDGLLAIARGVFERVGVGVAEVRTVDHEIPPGVWPDMTEHGYLADDFPAIHRELVVPADIVILAGPIWLGDQSSPTRKVIERLYAHSGDAYAGKVGGVLSTGDEHASAQVLYALEQIGLAVAPLPHATRDTVAMTWNLLDHARMLSGGGIPAHRDSTFDGDLTQPGHPHAEYLASVRG